MNKIFSAECEGNKYETKKKQNREKRGLLRNQMELKTLIECDREDVEFLDEVLIK